ncbi:hypothetical protein VA7868_00309 [Vibrio aerogenes CECT 7868]|uniref:Uncharacterized protein n=1 Tax=Vibrio aerogenes CECT 7868 TaxID=1216006 RepID=A0A1M5V9S0_9VIBR|nr:hypothetical protein VA7868_00309 [Vibrio aerogenes CECT 7868]
MPEITQVSCYLSNFLLIELRGGVKFPTGGDFVADCGGNSANSPRAPETIDGRRDSRSGEIPEPTVIVRMKEDRPDP